MTRSANPRPPVLEAVISTCVVLFVAAIICAYYFINTYKLLDSELIVQELFLAQVWDIDNTNAYLQKKGIAMRISGEVQSGVPLDDYVTFSHSVLEADQKIFSVVVEYMLMGTSEQPRNRRR